MRPRALIAALALLALPVAACDALTGERQTPFPAIPGVAVPREVVEAARAQASIAAGGSVVFDTAFAVELGDYCQGGICAGTSSGRGWGAVFDFTDRNGRPREVLVLLSSDLAPLMTQQSPAR